MFKVNEYFNGSVKSIAFQTETLPATVGVMAAGEYEFGTSQKEYMTVTSGRLTVVLPGSDTAQTFKAGETFEVEANQRFKVTAEVESSYLCHYEYLLIPLVISAVRPATVRARFIAAPCSIPRHPFSFALLLPTQTYRPAWLIDKRAQRLVYAIISIDHRMPRI